MLQDQNVAVVKRHNRQNVGWTCHVGMNVSWSFCGWVIHQGTRTGYSDFYQFFRSALISWIIHFFYKKTLEKKFSYILSCSLQNRSLCQSLREMVNLCTYKRNRKLCTKFRHVKMLLWRNVPFPPKVKFISAFLNRGGGWILSRNSK
jgi:hypothetical protein